MSLGSKIVYYMQPFVQHLLDTWMQPLPFPTILKCVYSCVLAFFILLPVIYPTVVALIWYAVLQFILERHFGIVFPNNWNFLKYMHRVYSFKVSNEKHLLFVTMYLERWRLLGSAIASSIDYMRLAFCLMFDYVDS